MEESSMKKTIVPQRLLVNAQSETCVTGHIYDPSDGLDKPTERDRRSWVFLNDPKVTLALTESPKKYFSKRKTLKNILESNIHFAKVMHDTIIIVAHDYWSTWWIKLDSNSTVQNMKHFKIQLLFNNPKNTAAVTSTDIKKYRCLKFRTPKNTPLILVCKIINSKNKI